MSAAWEVGRSSKESAIPSTDLSAYARFFVRIAHWPFAIPVYPAMAVIYDHVVVNKLAEVNKEALSRNAKWKIAHTADDLTGIEEFEFLQILGCPAVSVLQKNVKQELEGCLKLRNACGHPNSFKFAEAKVAAHVETLMLNVFDIF